MQNVLLFKFSCKIIRMWLGLKVFFVVLVASSLAYATQFAVGVSPPVVYVGEVEKGAGRLARFYIVTPSEDPLLVYMESEPGSFDFFKGSYADFVYNYSEEDMIPWIYFFSNPVELKPGNETLKTAGGEIKGWHEINLMVNVPDDAEPGYHVARLRPRPYVPSETTGAIGANVVSVVSVYLLLNVHGNAAREGIILDVVPGYSDKKILLNTYFKNTGTVTLTAKSIQKVYDADGNYIAEVVSPKTTIKPGLTSVLNAELPVDGINLSYLSVSSTVDYVTGAAHKNSTISMPEKVIVVKAGEGSWWWTMVIIMPAAVIIIFVVLRWWIQ